MRKNKAITLAVILALTLLNIREFSYADVSSLEINITAAKSGQLSDTRVIKLIKVRTKDATVKNLDINEIKRVLNDETIPYWRDHGNIKFSIDPAIDEIYIDKETTCDPNTALRNVGEVNQKYYSKNPKIPFLSRYIIALFPDRDSECGWGGVGSLGEIDNRWGLIYLQDDKLIQGNYVNSTLAHELGHNLGLNHTSLLTCPNFDAEEKLCDKGEYMGRIDIMSDQPYLGPLTIYSKLSIGMIDNDEIYKINGNKEITLLESSSNERGRRDKEIYKGAYFDDGKDTYLIEYRKEYDGYNKGLAIYRILSSEKPQYRLTAYNFNPSKTIYLLNFDDLSNKEIKKSPFITNFKNYSNKFSISIINESPESKEVRVKIENTSPSKNLKLWNLTTFNLQDRDLTNQNLTLTQSLASTPSIQGNISSFCSTSDNKMDTNIIRTSSSKADGSSLSLKTNTNLYSPSSSAQSKFTLIKDKYKKCTLKKKILIDTNNEFTFTLTTKTGEELYTYLKFDNIIHRISLTSKDKNINSQIYTQVKNSAISRY